MTIAVLGVATLDYEGLPDGFADRRRAEYASRVDSVAAEHDAVDLGIVGDLDAAEAVASRLAELDPAALVINPLIAARAQLVACSLRGSSAPTLVWSPADHPSYPDDLTATDAMLGSAPVGGFAAANVLVREGRAVLATQVAELGERERSWLRAAEHAEAFASARFAMVGGWFPGMSDCHLDPDALHRDLGPTVVEVQLPNPGPLDDPRSASRALADALEQVARGVDGVTVQCWSDEIRGESAFGVTACEGVSRLTTAGTPTACMGDLPTAVAMSFANAVTGASHYTEVDAVDRQRGGILLSNGGELDHRLARDGSTTCANHFFSGALGRGTAWAGALRPGPCALVGFTPTPDGWRLITADGDLLDERLDGFPVPHGFFASGLPPDELWARLVEAGTPHHAAVAAGPVRHAADLWCRLLGIEHVAIG